MKKMFFILAVMLGATSLHIGCDTITADDYVPLIALDGIKNLGAIMDQVAEKSPVLHENIGSVLSGTDADVHHHISKAIDACAQELRECPELQAKIMSLLWYLHAAAFFSEQNYALADANLARALEWLPTNALAYFVKGLIRQKKGKDKRAAEYIERAKELGFFMDLNTYMGSGNYEL